MGQGVESSRLGLGASLGFWYLLRVGVRSRLESIIEHMHFYVKGVISPLGEGDQPVAPKGGGREPSPP